MMDEREAALGGIVADVADDIAGKRSILPAAQPGDFTCPTCDVNSNTSYVYAVGRVEARFPRASIEKEFMQVAARDAESRARTGHELFHTVLSARENRYLVRQLCWVFTIQGIETYLLQPRDPADFELLAGAIRPRPSPLDLDIVIGQRGPTAPPELCNGITVPIVLFDQLYTFDRQSLIAAIPRPDGMSAAGFEPIAEELFDRIMQMTDNTGTMDDHRALNYLAMRYPAIYSTAAERAARDCFLSSIQVKPSRLNGTRRITECIFSFTDRRTDVVDKFFVRVDVTDEFPFLVTKISEYYDR